MHDQIVKVNITRPECRSRKLDSFIFCFREYKMFSNFLTFFVPILLDVPVGTLTFIA